MTNRKFNPINMVFPIGSDDSHKKIAELRAQRDRAVELLREVAPYLERHAQILHDRINAFLAEQQSCQRCGGDGV
jgi:hypothetical protein